jgi:DNA-binding NtrC family response regulator
VPGERLTSPARERLQGHAFPGNVRELENALERALIIAGDEPIDAGHFDGALRTARKGAAAAEPVTGDLLVPGFNLDAHERSVIDAALERAGGNKAQAARLLGITRRRLYSRLDSLAEKLADDEK